MSEQLSAGSQNNVEPEIELIDPVNEDRAHGLVEVGSRDNGRVVLLLDKIKKKVVVDVFPNDEELLPFGLLTTTENALDVYHHPYFHEARLRDRMIAAPLGRLALNP